MAAVAHDVRPSRFEDGRKRQQDPSAGDEFCPSLAKGPCFLRLHHLRSSQPERNFTSPCRGWSAALIDRGFLLWRMSLQDHGRTGRRAPNLHHGPAGRGVRGARGARSARGPRGPRAAWAAPPDLARAGPATAKPAAPPDLARAGPATAKPAAPPDPARAGPATAKPAAPPDPAPAGPATAE